jgi:hypothetical protein
MLLCIGFHLLAKKIIKRMVMVGNGRERLGGGYKRFGLSPTVSPVAWEVRSYQLKVISY